MYTLSYKIPKYFHEFIGFYRYIKIQNSGPRYTSKAMPCPKCPSIFDWRGVLWKSTEY
jgi:hypothetical protein